MNKKIICIGCHKIKQSYAKGMCKICYNKWYYEFTKDDDKKMEGSV